MIARIAGRRTPRHLLIVLAAGLLAAAASWAAPQRHLVQGWLIDVTAAVRAVAFGIRPLDDAAVVVVTVGSRSLDSPELAGMPRALFSPVWAALTAKAFAAGATSVAYDFILAYDAGRMVIGGETPLKDFDRDFLRLLHEEGRKGRIILGRSGTVLPARRFQQVLGADQLGLVEAPVGPGNVVRRVRYAITGEGGTTLPTLSGLSLRSAGVDPPGFTYIVPTGPLDTIPSVELIDVLKCSERAPLEEVFGNRLVFIGSALAGEDRLKGPGRLIPDRGGTAPPDRARGRAPDDPCRLLPGEHRAEHGGSMPGVFLHAAAADAVLSGWAPVPAPGWLRVVLVGVAAAIGAALAIFGQLRWAIAGIAVLVVAVFCGGVVLLEEGVLLASADPLMAGPALFAAGWAVRISLLDAQARVIRREFGRYLAPALIERMIDQETVPELGGESRIVTVMFADLSGFTRLSSELAESELFSVLNDYLDACARIVQEHGGYVDKFIGDAVMAVWNAPAELADHPRQAVLAGLAMSRAVDAIAQASAAEGRPGLKIKVAINTGPALVGNIGSRERMNYTVVGSAVNVAARLEDLPRIFEARVIMGESTARAVERDFVVLPVAAVRLEGISGPVEIFSPLAAAGEADGSLRALVGEYARARRLAEDGRLREAVDIWDRLAVADWPGAGPSAVMLRRTMEERDGAVEGPGQAAL
ncbi:MAG TPA: adenylate/guanylate cyclase domain-containing protein [Paracoccaceae bacterium]|nr:adenylate/guanylate cyclase domain-containing protein [Paracoccaceae bacterium]